MKKKHWSSMPFCKPLTLTHWVNFLRVLVGWVTEKIFLLPTSVITLLQWQLVKKSYWWVFLMSNYDSIGSLNWLKALLHKKLLIEYRPLT